MALRTLALVPACVSFLVACGPQVGEPQGGPSVDAGFMNNGDDDDDDDGSGDDDGAVCPATPCSILEQCGCAAGLACDLDPDAFASAGAICRTATAAGTDKSKCTTDQECAVGYSCLGNQCRTLCDADTDCGANRCDVRISYTAAGGATAYVPGIEACTKSCRLDVLGAPGGCPESIDIGCRGFSDAGVRYTDCSPVKAGAGAGATCASSADCARGFACTGASVCRQSCAISVGGQPQQNTCPSGATACTAYTAPGYQIGDVVYGYCPG